MSINYDGSKRSSSPMTTSFPRRLRLVVREEENNDNLFVRLSSAMSFDLHSVAVRQPNEEISAAYPRESGDAWTIFEERSKDSVSFLPLCISFGDDNIILGSYNGGACVSSSEKDIIEVPRAMLPDLSNGIPEFVSVHVLPRVDYGAQVVVEPATVADWELLEIYSNFMEEGGLLSQVSVVYPGQELAIRIHGIDVVNIRVKQVTTRASSNPIDDFDSIWPDVSSNGNGLRKLSEEKNPLLQCVLLIQDTEMIVEPKARPRKESTQGLDPFQLIPSDLDWGASVDKLSTLTGRIPFRVDPGCVLVKTERWQFKTEWAQIISEDSNQMRVVRVMTSSRVPNNTAVLFIGTRLDLHLSVHQGFIYLRPLTYTQEEPLERILLEEVCFKYDQRSLASWNIPNIDLEDFLFKRNVSDSNYRVDRAFFPVGAVIPMPSKFDSRKGTHVSDRWFRIAFKESKSYSEGHVVRLNVGDIFDLLKRRPQICNESLSTVVVPDTSTMQRPPEIILSSDWTKPIIDRMKHFSSTFVTLSGASGSGKTHSALLLSTLVSFFYNRPMYYLDCKKLQKSKLRMSEILEEIDSLFARALLTKSSIIVLDDVDILSPNLCGNGNDGDERTHTVNPAAIDQSKLIGDRLSHLFKALDLRGNNSGGHLFFIATCSSEESINPSISKSSRGPIIHTKVPLLSAEDRSSLLKAILRRHNPKSRLNFDRSDISRRTEGFIPRDFEKLALRALRSYRMHFNAQSFEDILVTELANFTPIAKISNPKGKDQFNIAWSDVGGLFDTKEILESIIRQPLLYRRIYTKAQIQLPRGILLYGPSGCGKSYLVPALARKCNYPLITCKGPEVLDKYIGASEAKVRELFERASQMAPSILFLDELDSLAPRRGSDSTGVTDRVVNQLLTFLDGVEDVSSNTVFIIGATSRPDKVDPAIVRPGRLEKHLYVGPPQSAKEWSDLLVKIAKKWNLKEESLRSLSAGEKIVDLVIDTPRLCPADISAAFDTAHLNAVHRKLNEKNISGDINKIEIGVEDIKLGFEDINPSLCENEARILESIYNSFRGGNRSDSNAESKVEFRKLKTSLR